MERSRVVITGMGAMTPLGQTPEKLWANLVAGKSGIGPMTLCDPTDYPCRISGDGFSFPNPPASFSRDVLRGFEARGSLRWVHDDMCWRLRWRSRAHDDGASRLRNAPRGRLDCCGCVGCGHY